VTLTDHTFGDELLGEVQALRYMLERLDSRAAARAFKPRLLSLYEASKQPRVPPYVARIVDGFFVTAHEMIVQFYGRAAWDDPETREEALLRMGNTDDEALKTLSIISCEPGKPARFQCRICGEYFDGPPATSVQGGAPAWTGKAPACPRASEHPRA
jgi:hypothetical protein